MRRFFSKKEPQKENKKSLYFSKCNRLLSEYELRKNEEFFEVKKWRSVIKQIEEFQHSLPDKESETLESEFDSLFETFEALKKEENRKKYLKSYLVREMDYQLKIFKRFLNENKPYPRTILFMAHDLENCLTELTHAKDLKTKNIYINTSEKKLQDFKNFYKDMRELYAEILIFNEQESDMQKKHNISLWFYQGKFDEVKQALPTKSADKKP